MGRLTRIAGVLFLVIFVAVLALRPLLNNPAISQAIMEGDIDRRLLFWVPLLLVTVAIIGLRVWSVRRDEEPPAYEAPGPDNRQDSHNSWADETSWSVAENETAADDDDDESTDRSHNPGRPDILTGQGGARNRGFEIEEREPDAGLHDHLEHLEAELGDDFEVAEDLQGMAEVAEEYEEESNIPLRCPQEHCDARWRERKLIGFDDGGRFELIDDGSKALCLECEQTYSLE